MRYATVARRCTSSSLFDSGIAAPIFRSAAFLDVGACFDHLEIFLGRDVVSLVGDRADESAAGALLGLVHQQLEFPHPRLSSRSLGGELLAVKELKLTGVGKTSDWIFERRRTRGQECGKS